jgi:hypothetical protein
LNAIQLPSQPPNSARLTGATSGLRSSLIHSGDSWPHHLADVGRVHRDPAALLQEHLGTAVLRALQLGRIAAELAVAELRRRDADAVDVAGRHADRAAQADEQAVDVAALAAEIAGLRASS